MAGRSQAHSPVEDAAVTLTVYSSVAKEWERQLAAGQVPRGLKARKSDSSRQKRKVRGAESRCCRRRRAPCCLALPGHLRHELPSTPSNSIVWLVGGFAVLWALERAVH